MINMPIGYKIGIAIYLIVIIQCIAVSSYIYARSQKSPLLYSLLACQTAIILWLAIGIMGIMSTSDAEMMLFNRLGMVPIMLISPLWLIFILYYVEIIKKKNKYIVGLILLPIIFCIWPLASKNYLYLMIESKSLANPGVTEWGVLFYIGLAITYLYVIASIVIIIVKSIKEKIGIGITTIVLITIILPSFISIAGSTKLIDFIWIDWTPVTFAVFFAVLSPLVFKYRFIKISPIAAYALFLNVNEAAFIIDKNSRIEEYNPACHSYFDALFDITQCGSIDILLSNIRSHTGVKEAETIEKLIEHSSGTVNEVYDSIISVSRNDELRKYAVCLMPLKTSSKVSVRTRIWDSIYMIRQLRKLSLITSIIKQPHRFMRETNRSFRN